MANWTNQNKSSDPTFRNKVRKGTDVLLGDIAHLTFEDTIDFLDADSVEIKDKTFSELSDTSWSNESKSADPTYQNETRN